MLVCMAGCCGGGSSKVTCSDVLNCVCTNLTPKSGLACTGGKLGITIAKDACISINEAGELAGGCDGEGGITCEKVTGCVHVAKPLTIDKDDGGNDQIAIDCAELAKTCNLIDDGRNTLIHKDPTTGKLSLTCDDINACIPEPGVSCDQVTGCVHVAEPLTIGKDADGKNQIQLDCPAVAACVADNDTIEVIDGKLVAKQTGSTFTCDDLTGCVDNKTVVIEDGKLVAKGTDLDCAQLDGCIDQNSIKRDPDTNRIEVNCDYVANCVADHNTIEVVGGKLVAKPFTCEDLAGCVDDKTVKIVDGKLVAEPQTDCEQVMTCVKDNLTDLLADCEGQRTLTISLDADPDPDGGSQLVANISDYTDIPDAKPVLRLKVGDTWYPFDAGHLEVRRQPCDTDLVVTVQRVDGTGPTATGTVPIKACKTDRNFDISLAWCPTPPNPLIVTDDKKLTIDKCAVTTLAPMYAASVIPTVYAQWPASELEAGTDVAPGGGQGQVINLVNDYSPDCPYWGFVHVFGDIRIDLADCITETTGTASITVALQINADGAIGTWHTVRDETFTFNCDTGTETMHFSREPGRVWRLRLDPGRTFNLLGRVVYTMDAATLASGLVKSIGGGAMTAYVNAFATTSVAGGEAPNPPILEGLM